MGMGMGRVGGIPAPMPARCGTFSTCHAFAIACAFDIRSTRLVIKVVMDQEEALAPLPYSGTDKFVDPSQDRAPSLSGK